MHIHLINLDRSPDRLAEFRAINRNLAATITRFPAVDGRALDPDALVRQGLVTSDILSPAMFSMGALGCALSNIALWDKAIATGEFLTICEDDAILNDRFEPCAEAILKTLPADWDLIYWGFNFDMFVSFEMLPGVSHATTMLDQDRMRANIEAFQRQAITPQAFKVLWAFGTCCYSISPKGARTLKQKILPLAPRVTPFPEGARAYPYSPSWRHVGVDNSINAVHREIKSFVCFPPLAISKNDSASSTVQSDKPARLMRQEPSHDHGAARLGKDLIIVRAGRHSLHTSWLDQTTPRGWELLVCPYEEIAPQQGGGLLVSDVITSSKWAALRILLKEWQGWRDYRYVLLADDDLLATAETWSRFFDRCAHYGARLAQPALKIGSYFSHGLTMQNTQFVARRVSYVEGMMPCFRSDVLAQLQQTLDLSESGSEWGLDFLWAKQLDYKDIFVIDETPVLHTRSVHLRSDNISAYGSERATFIQEHQPSWTLKTFSGFLADGTEISERDGSFLYRLFQGYQHVFETDPKCFEDMIKLQIGIGDSRPVRPTTRRVKCAVHPNRASSGAPRTTAEVFLDIAPFLNAAHSPEARRENSRAFDERIAALLDHTRGAALPQIHCFYEVGSEAADHRVLIAAVASMRAAGHPVRVWSYSPQKLEFLQPHGVELHSGEDVLPRLLFERVVKGSGVRYFSDIFRYAVLYELGGLWMDTDVVVLRPFPFHGDHFFNLQWGSGPEKADFVCGNVMYAEQYSRHMRSLYETSIERFFASRDRWGMAGPKLLSDYIASDAGAELCDRVFSPMLFNPIDWTEIDCFNKPLAEIKDYLNDERVFGIHLWTALNTARPSDEGASLVSLLYDPLRNFPPFTGVADQFNTDKNRHTGNSHCYARVYDRLLSARRFSMRRLMEIGLCRGLEEGRQTETPSVALWQSYFPFCHVIGLDLTDFSQFNNERFTSYVCDQSKLEDLRATAGRLEPGSIDVIVDDGSHASLDQQLTLREFWPLLADGGWYFIEDLDWQPPGEDTSKIALTKALLRELKDYGGVRSLDPVNLSGLAGEFAEILFFDSHFELNRAKLLGGLVAIRKRGGSGLVR